MRIDGEATVLANEFAVVKLWVDRSANGPRLAVQQCRSGATVYLDPLELEGLTNWSYRSTERLVLAPKYDAVDGSGSGPEPPQGAAPGR